MPAFTGLLFLGTLSACGIAFVYSLLALRGRAPSAVRPLPEPTFGYVVFDSVLIGLFVDLALLLAVLLQLERPYWVTVSCLAVIQGMSLRAVWNRQLHRVAGTTVGLLLAWALLLLPLDRWSIAAIMTLLAFIIELLVVRHYGFAAVFITPLTILLAEAPTLGETLPGLLIQARFVDTALGCLVGLAGGLCIHSPRLRSPLERQMRRLIPERFVLRQRGAEG